MEARLSSKGQITIPKACRDKLGLKTGAVLDFRAEDGVLVARKVQPEDVFAKWRGRGKLPGGQTVDAYLAGVRS